jgi:hypothetical protein
MKCRIASENETHRLPEKNRKKFGATGIFGVELESALNALLSIRLHFAAEVTNQT